MGGKYSQVFQLYHRQMQDSFFRVFGVKITLRGVSRTDKGVHADKHVAFFCAPKICDPQVMKFAWSNSLPDDIFIRDLVYFQKIVHPHALVLKKTYQYTIFQRRPSPFECRYGWYVVKLIPMGKLKKSFRSFYWYP